MDKVASESTAGEDGREVFASVEHEGPLRRKSLLTSHSAASPKKVHPVGGDVELSTKSASLEKKASKYTKAEAQAKTSPKTTQGVVVLVLPLSIGLAVCICLAWTLWLLLLNILPNDTVNRVMDTETFDYGTFWFMIKPSTALMGLAAFGLSVVALGYFAALVRMLVRCRRDPKQAYVVNHSGSKKVHFAQKVELLQDATAGKKPRTEILSSAKLLASSLALKDSPARKYLVSFELHDF